MFRRAIIGWQVSVTTFFGKRTTTSNPIEISFANKSAEIALPFSSQLKVTCQERRSPVINNGKAHFSRNSPSIVSRQMSQCRTPPVEQRMTHSLAHSYFLILLIQTCYDSFIGFWAQRGNSKSSDTQKFSHISIVRFPFTPMLGRQNCGITGASVANRLYCLRDQTDRFHPRRLDIITIYNPYGHESRTSFDPVPLRLDSRDMFVVMNFCANISVFPCQSMTVIHAINMKEGTT